MRHVYECPMRWADMDQLGHVNNVTYVDYLQEARIDMLTAHAPVRGGEELAEGVVVVRHEVGYVAPLVFRAAPITVECWVSDVRAATFTMCYEIVDHTDAGRVVYLRARTVLSPFVFAEERPRRITAEEKQAVAPLREDGIAASSKIPARPAVEVGRDVGTAYPLAVRWSDVDAYGHVNNVKYFEFFQEARISYLAGLPQPEDGPWTNWVVAHTDVDYRRPILFRLQPYAVHTWLDRVGGRSMVLVSEIRDGEEVLARAQVVLVAFDPTTQRSAEMPEGQRRRLLGEVVGAPA